MLTPLQSPRRSKRQLRGHQKSGNASSYSIKPWISRRSYVRKTPQACTDAFIKVHLTDNVPLLFLHTRRWLGYSLKTVAAWQVQAVLPKAAAKQSAIDPVVGQEVTHGMDNMLDGIQDSAY